MAIWRAVTEDFIARGESDWEGWIERFREWVHPEIEFDVGEGGKYAHLATFRYGLMVHWKLYAKQSEALDAAGVSG